MQIQIAERINRPATSPEHGEGLNVQRLSIQGERKCNTRRISNDCRQRVRAQTDCRGVLKGGYLKKRLRFSSLDAKNAAMWMFGLIPEVFPLTTGASSTRRTAGSDHTGNRSGVSERELLLPRASIRLPADTGPAARTAARRCHLRW